MTLIALIPVVGYDVTLRPRRRCRCSATSTSAGSPYPLTVLWIALLANLVNLIDGMDSLAAGIVAIAAASFAILSASFGRMDAAVAVGDRVRRDAGVPVPQLPPGEDLHGRLRRARAGLPARHAVGRGRAQDRRDDHAGRRRCSCSPCRSSTRRSWCSSGSSTAAPPWARRPQPLLPPVHAHRLLPAAHRRLPAPVGAAAGRLRAAGPLRAAAPARRLGPRALAAADGRRPARDRRARSGWSTRSRSSRARHLHAVGLRRFGQRRRRGRASRASPRRPSSARSRRNASR